MILRIIQGALAASLLSGCVASPVDRQREQADIAIVGGQLFDGTGAPGRADDVVINDGRIIYVGGNAQSRFDATQIIDATNLIVAPGFIDPHTHAGADLASSDPARRTNHAFAFQGVSTVVVGNDGGGSPEIATLAEDARDGGLGSNSVYVVGFGPIREAVLGSDNRAPEPNELGQMQDLIRQAMCEGAWGFSTGLYYVPQNYAETEEVLALAHITAEFGGYYDTHLRDESTYNVGVEGALDEALTIGRTTGMPVHIAHIKALGPAVWGHSAQMIEMIEEAQASGQIVTADQYPWEASGTRISNALVPRWALEGGLTGLQERLRDEELSVQIRTEMVEALARRGGADRLLITGRLGGSQVDIGITLLALAEADEVSPIDAAIDILQEGDARVASFNMNPADISALAQREWVVTGSDGSTGHPRRYASFPKAYVDLVRGEAAMPMERFIRRSSGQTADIIGLRDRGYLRAGMAADVLVFDAERFAPRATYQSPRELSSGVVHLFVNGTAVIRHGQATGALSGQPLLKPASC